MKKCIISLILLLPSFVLAQSAYMHEAQSDGGSFSGLNTIFNILGIALLLFLLLFILPLVIREKIDDAKTNRKSVSLNNVANIQNNASNKIIKDKDDIGKEAEYVLSHLAYNRQSRGYVFFQVFWDNDCFKEWFYQGYRDGKKYGEQQTIEKEGAEYGYERITWEEYVELRFSKIGESQEQIDKLCNGNVEKSKSAYVEGRKRGIKYKGQRIDGYQQIY